MKWSCTTCLADITLNRQCPRCGVRVDSLGRPRFKMKPCGSRAAYRRHIRHNEVPCDPCTAANTDWYNTYRLAKDDRPKCSTCHHPVDSHNRYGRCRFARCVCLGSPELTARETT